jgi:hypothetical protein
MSDNLSISSLSDQKWKTALPPPELFHSPPGTSHDIESILESSIQQLQALHKLQDRLERQQQLAEERDRLERQRLAAEENSFQQQQELHLLSILKERSEREFTATGSNPQRQQQRAAEEQNVSASKGKEKSTQEPQENVPNVVSFGKHTFCAIYILIGYRTLSGPHRAAVLAMAVVTNRVSLHHLPRLRGTYLHRLQGNQQRQPKAPLRLR